MNREKARQQFIKVCMQSTTMSGIEADSLFHARILPIILELSEIHDEIPKDVEKPKQRIKDLLKQLGWSE